MKTFIKQTKKEYKCNCCGNIANINIYQEKIKNKNLITSICEKCDNYLIQHYQDNIFKIKENQFIYYYDNDNSIIDQIESIIGEKIKTSISKIYLNKNEFEIYIPMPEDWCLFAMYFDEGVSPYTLMRYGEQDSIKWPYIIPFTGILPNKL